MHKEEVISCRWHLTEPAMKVLAHTIAKHIEPGTILFLYGSLGAGKTTLVRALLNGLGYQDKVKSPTYALVEPYDINGCAIFHFDLYRVQDAQELYSMGMEEYFTPQSICLIEWPERGLSVLPTADIVCHLTFKDEGRDLYIETYTKRGKKLLGQIINSARTD